VPAPVQEAATETETVETRYIYIDQSTQHMLVYDNGQLVRDIPCSTGLPTDQTYTPAWSGNVGHYVGTFFSFDVYADEGWYLFMSDGGILIHSLPYLLDENGAKVYQDREYLGVQPASHGCIRISPEDAAWLTAWGPEGVPCTGADPYLELWQ
jgi:lipoprotein-anchoring transpeptidase ErfK/SrfK